MEQQIVQLVLGELNSEEEKAVWAELLVNQYYYEYYCFFRELKEAVIQIMNGTYERGEEEISNIIPLSETR